MADLQRIQNQIDQITELLQEVADLKPVSGQNTLEPSFNAEDIVALETHIGEWKVATAEILREECSKDDANRFLTPWSAPIRQLSFKEHYSKKLQNSRKYLNTLIVTLKEKEQYRATLNDIWALVHPEIEAISRRRFEDQYYADAVAAACKAINDCIREMVEAKTGESLEGAALLQRAFSQENPVIRFEDSVSQEAYRQLFTGALTAFGKNENITMEDAMRKLMAISILMEVIDNATAN